MVTFGIPPRAHTFNPEFLDVSFFSHVKKHRSLLWLATTRLRMKIYDTAFCEYISVVRHTSEKITKAKTERQHKKNQPISYIRKNLIFTTFTTVAFFLVKCLNGKTESSPFGDWMVTSCMITKRSMYGVHVMLQSILVQKQRLGHLLVKSGHAAEKKKWKKKLEQKASPDGCSSYPAEFLLCFKELSVLRLSEKRIIDCLPP